MSEQNNTNETAQTNETTQEKLEGAFDAFGSRLDGIGWKLLRVAGLLMFLYLPAASIIERLPMPQLSDVQIVFIGAFIGGMAVMYLPTAKAISKIYSPKKEIVAKIDGTSESVLDAWSASPDKVDNMTVTDGVVRTKMIHGKVVHLVNEFDPDENTGKAPRRMEIPDWELWGEKEAIERQRHRNNAFIEFGKQLFIRLPAIGQQLEGKYWRKMSQNQVEKELKEPESFLEAVESELPDLDPEVTEEMRAAHESAKTPDKAGEEDE